MRRSVSYTYPTHISNTRTLITLHTNVAYITHLHPVIFLKGEYEEVLAKYQEWSSADVPLNEYIYSCVLVRIAVWGKKCEHRRRKEQKIQ